MLRIFKYLFLNKDIKKAVKRIRKERLSFLKKRNLYDLHMAALKCAKLDGIMIDAGVALGGTSIVIAKTKAPAQKLYMYDVYGMIPPPSDKDGEDVKRRYEEISTGKAKGFEGDTYYGYEKDLYTKVHNTMVDFGLTPETNNINMIKGLFEDTMDIKENVAFANIDGDWYNSVKTCLERIMPKLLPGGTVVIDDYFAWSGARDATNDYFKDKPDFNLVKVGRGKRPRLHISRK